MPEFSRIFDVPMSLDETAEFNRKQTKHRIKRHARTANEFLLGPMPVDDFLAAFLPPAGAENSMHRLSSWRAFNAVPSSASKASDIYEPLIKALNKSTKHKSRCPGFIFDNASSRVKNSKRPGFMKPEVCCYATRHLEDVMSSPIKSRTDLGYAAFFIDVKPEPEDDFLRDPSSDATREAWDSHQFVYNIEDEALFDDVEQRLGQHVFYATEIDAEETIFREAVIAAVRFQLDVDGEDLTKAVAEHYQPGMVSAICMRVEDGDSRGVRQYLFSRPLVSPSRMTGRGTRGYWAVDTKDRQVVFLKDAWRLAAGNFDQEGVILRELNESGIRNIPKLLCHGDVRDGTTEDDDGYQRTATNQCLTEPWVCGLKSRCVAISKYVHYRLVSGPAGYGLQKFKGTNELLHATYDVYQAMLDVYRKSDRIHRDISVGNIILVRVPGHAMRQGYLIDWEVSCKVDSSGLALVRGRMGTWQFMSYLVLINHQALHTFHDDMESLLTLFRLFDDYREQTGYNEGGDAKNAEMISRTFTRYITFTNKSLQKWLHTVLEYRNPCGWMLWPYPDTWLDPEHLNRFWKDFLDSNVLSTDDRIDRILQDTEQCSQASETPDSPSAVSLGKRKVRESSQDAAEATVPKRSRLDNRREGRPSKRELPAPSTPSRKRKLEVLDSSKSKRPRLDCGPVTRSKSRQKLQQEAKPNKPDLGAQKAKGDQRKVSHNPRRTRNTTKR
ncbi:hypothetical protein A0H81_08700 [Grifola frondosa]|uniref:Fungal-type protein kinase domain-containing protein n=1 Tax=Grifola frondosa TaxID=5627 RepID=A0A1C7M2U3_GRIFR|nr:hypothetical protein A0H81_08700 [Grifola frondosa]